MGIAVEIFTNIPAQIEALDGILGKIQANLQESAIFIESGIRTELIRAYGARLALRWNTQTESPQSSELTRFHVWTTDPYVFGYEFGTPAHTILPKTQGGVLAFQTSGGLVFARSVQHPGTTGRNRREQIKSSFATIAEQQWRIAIDSALGT